MTFRYGDLALRNYGQSLFVLDPGHIAFMIAAGNFFGFVGNPSKFAVTSSQVGYLALHDDLPGAIHALGRSWKEALQDPGWWTLAILTTASIAERGTLLSETQAAKTGCQGCDFEDQ